MPWYLKVLAKIVLARLPFGYEVFRGLGVFRHGDMDSKDYAINVFRVHHQRAVERGLGRSFVALEIGPGDSVASAILAMGAGASEVILVDSGPFAVRDMSLYRAVATAGREHGFAIPATLSFNNLDALLDSCNARYLATGLDAFNEVKSETVDFIWSHAVLEHVRLAQLPDLIAASFRVLKPGGTASHRVDLRDHLGGGLNNLRFAERVWESKFMFGSGFYTNRVRLSEMMELFRDVGFKIEALSVERWDQLPLPKRAMSGRFRRCDDDDLLVRGFDILLSRPGGRNNL
jgi:SAM-dependent methyltransferase